MRLQVRHTLHSAALEITRAVPYQKWRVRIPSWTALTLPAKTPSTSVTWRPWGEVTKCSQCNAAVSVSQAPQLTRPTTITGHPTPVRTTVRERLGPIRCITSQVGWQHSHHRASVGVSNPAIPTQMFYLSLASRPVFPSNPACRRFFWPSMTKRSTRSTFTKPHVDSMLLRSVAINEPTVPAVSH